MLNKVLFADFKISSAKLVFDGRYACTQSSLLKNGFVQSFQVLDNKDENKKLA